MRAQCSRNSVEALLRHLQGNPLHDPPGEVLEGALALGRQLKRRSRTAGRWLVELLFDSAAWPLTAGVRAGGRVERRLLYLLRQKAARGTPCHLDLRVRREPGGSLEVTGQLLPPWQGARVEARLARARRRQPLGGAGEFLFRGLPATPGALRLEIHGDDHPPLVLEGIPLAGTREISP